MISACRAVVASAQNWWHDDVGERYAKELVVGWLTLAQRGHQGTDNVDLSPVFNCALSPSTVARDEGVARVMIRCLFNWKQMLHGKLRQRALNTSHIQTDGASLTVVAEVAERVLRARSTVTQTASPLYVGIDVGNTSLVGGVWTDQVANAVRDKLLDSDKKHSHYFCDQRTLQLDN